MGRAVINGYLELLLPGNHGTGFILCSRCAYQEFRPTCKHCIFEIGLITSQIMHGIMAFPASLIAGILWQGAFGWPGWGARAPFLFGSGMAIVAVLLIVF